MGETKREDTSAPSDVVFCGIKHGTSEAGIVRIIDPTGTHTPAHGTWYRPNVGSVSADLARFADGERVLVRIVGDAIVKATTPLTDSSDRSEELATARPRRGRPPGKTKGGNPRQTVVAHDILDADVKRDEAIQRVQTTVDNLDRRRCQDCHRTFMSASILVGGKCPPCRSK